MEETKSLCEEKIFSSVYRTYSDKLFNYLYYQCGDEALSQDVLQEAFAKLWQNCAKVARNTAEGFVFMSARNHLFNVFKRNKVRLKFQSTFRPDHTSRDPHSLLEEKQVDEIFQQAVSELSPKQREVFLMSRIDNMKYREIAATLEISEKAVEKRMNVALKHLKSIYDKMKK